MTNTPTKLLTAGELADTLDQLDPDTIITWADLDDDGRAIAAGITRVDEDGNADIGYLRDTSPGDPKSWDWNEWLRAGKDPDYFEFLEQAAAAS